jgi:hypothetical protein
MNGEDPLDQAGPGDPDINPDALLDGTAATDLKDDIPNSHEGDTLVADASNIGDAFGFEDHEQYPPPPPEIVDGTVFYGGAGLDGPYIEDMVEALEQAGIFEPRAVNPSGKTKGIIADAIRSGTTLRDRDNEPPEAYPFYNSKDPHNMIGYSYGSGVAAQDALDHADLGGRVDNIVLIGSPISSELLRELMDHPNIGRVIVVDLTEHGDPIRAGMPAGELYASVPELIAQMQTSVTDGEGHFYYAPSNETGALRGRELADFLRDQMGQ